MGMMIGRNDSNMRRVVIKNADGTPAASISYSTPSQKKKKRLQYNFKAMSAQIMQAKTSGNASRVASKARREIAMLQRNMKNGEYDEDEIKNSIAHAKSLERVARKRVKHLRQEEALKENQKPYLSEMEEAVEDLFAEDMDAEEMLKLSEEELKRLMRELQEAMKEVEAEADGEISDLDSEDNLTEIVQENLDAMDLEQLKKKHRSDELREIMEADMKYLKALFNKLAKEKQQASIGGNNSSSDSVSLQLSGMDVPVQTSEMPVVTEGGNMDISI
ncbi:MAG: hypothetical protein J1E03_03295 [Acetatifactor sp.]|nr:hypothetical protein [Acetatifactor sp.]